MKLEDAINEVYQKFKLHFYQEAFAHFKNREATLTTVETFCMEIIYALGTPTINEFANFIGISSPNATYKVNNLIKKGYINKIRNEADKREYHLEVTQKYLEYYNISYKYVETVVNRLKDRLPEAEQENLQKILEIMSRELMPELPGEFHGYENEKNDAG